MISESDETGDWGTEIWYQVKNGEVRSILAFLSALWRVVRLYERNAKGAIRRKRILFRDSTGIVISKPADLEDWSGTQQYTVPLFKVASDFPFAIRAALGYPEPKR